MADENAQGLARAARVGDAEAEAALLRGRLRRGEITAERLALAADLGYEAARLCLGRAEATPELYAWLDRVAAWGAPVLTAVTRELLLLQPAHEPQGPLGLRLVSLEDTRCLPPCRPGDTIRAGRAEDLELTVPDRLVSALHLRLSCEAEGELQVADLGSTNGTFIDGHVRQRGWLEPGTTVQIGRSLLFREQAPIELEPFLKAAELYLSGETPPGPLSVAGLPEPRPGSDRAELARFFALRALRDATLEFPAAGPYLPLSASAIPRWRAEVGQRLGPRALAGELHEGPPPSEDADEPAPAGPTWAEGEDEVPSSFLAGLGRRPLLPELNVRRLAEFPDRPSRRARTWIASGGAGELCVVREVQPERAEPLVHPFSVGLCDRQSRVPALRCDRLLEVADLPHQAPSFVLAYVPGVPLPEWRRAHPGRAAALELAGRLCEVFGELVRAELLWPDVRPPTVLVDAEDGELGLIGTTRGQWRAALARQGRAMIDYPRDLPNRGFLAPEQLLGHSDERSFVFLAGALLHWLLSGQLPFSYGTRHSRRERLKAGERITPRALPDEVEPALAELVRCCLETDPEERPADLAALRSELSKQSG
ncbi:MAG TPA: hypothetical protein DEA08_31100 [Planctomycetes bacterium]|nr:hypothetical protein [Planctomycetota bacterium]